MKTTIGASALGLCISIMLMTACQKSSTEPTNPAQPAASSEIKADETQGTLSAKRRPNACYDPRNKKCYMFVVCNCVILKEIVITPKLYEDMIRVSTSENPQVVGEFFRSGQAQVLGEEMDPEYLAKLRSGSYFISLASSDNVEATFLAGTHYPVTSDNQEFAFQYTRRAN